MHLLVDYTALKRIWSTPRALYECLIAQKKEVGKNERDQSKTVSRNWYHEIVKDSEINTIFSSNKMIILFDILEECKNRKEKLLVFSTSINVLSAIEHFLKQITIVTRNNIAVNDKEIGTHRGIWRPGVDYFRLDGTTDVSKRQENCNSFNDSNSKSRLFLISTKAGALGYNMYGANRVILLDTSWNPADDNQSIFRAYRLQQKNICYIYRLVCTEMMEQTILSRSVTKQAVSYRVVDAKQIIRQYNLAELREMYMPKSMPNTSNRKSNDDVLATICLNRSSHIFGYHGYDALLENLPEEELDDIEEAAAFEEYRNVIQPPVVKVPAPVNVDLTNMDVPAVQIPLPKGRPLDEGIIDLDTSNDQIRQPHQLSTKALNDMTHSENNQAKRHKMKHNYSQKMLKQLSKYMHPSINQPMNIIAKANTNAWCQNKILNKKTTSKSTSSPIPSTSVMNSDSFPSTSVSNNS